MANEMRDRLVELLNETFDAQYTKSVLITAEHTADYIIADGWIRPPCKVGDHIYYVFSGNASLPFGESRIKPLLVRAIASTEDKKGWFVRVGFSGIVHDFKFSDFGKIVFLTKSEAEQKLKEMRGE